MPRIDWIVTFSIPEAPNEFASVVAHRKLDIPEVEAWVKSMFGTDITVQNVVPLRPDPLTLYPKIG